MIILYLLCKTNCSNSISLITNLIKTMHVFCPPVSLVLQCDEFRMKWKWKYGARLAVLGPHRRTTVSPGYVTAPRRAWSVKRSRCSQVHMVVWLSTNEHTCELKMRNTQKAMGIPVWCLRWEQKRRENIALPFAAAVQFAEFCPRHLPSHLTLKVLKNVCDFRSLRKRRASSKSQKAHCDADPAQSAWVRCLRASQDKKRSTQFCAARVWYYLKICSMAGNNWVINVHDIIFIIEDLIAHMWPLVTSLRLRARAKAAKRSPTSLYPTRHKMTHM